MICHTGVAAIFLVAGRFTLEGNPILGFPLQQLIAQERPLILQDLLLMQRTVGWGTQRLYPDVSCWSSMTQQLSGLTALKLPAGQTSYGTSEPMGNHEKLLYFVTRGRKRNVRKWGPGELA